MIDVFNRLKGRLLTSLNLIYTSVLMWLSTAGNLPPVETLVEFLPEGARPLGRLLLPVFAGVLVQVAAELLKKDATQKASQ